ncbi:hypothetical protein [Caballeronia sp. Lep1P3]|uniref:hypothetical protein n=1 Tax=Caballeronia sp. Lep1P3 TaxID=2878150 RepID=UPI001FD3FD70|nr:hypothetical protein [Caballeronia sp. Lep1P3]
MRFPDAVFFVVAARSRGNRRRRAASCAGPAVKDTALPQRATPEAPASSANLGSRKTRLAGQNFMPTPTPITHGSILSEPILRSTPTRALDGRQRMPAASKRAPRFVAHRQERCFQVCCLL